MSLDVFYRLDVNIVAFVFLGIFLLVALKRLDPHDGLNRLFFFVSAIVMTQLLIEAGTVWINRQDNLSLIPLSQGLHMVLFIVGPTISIAWFYFLLFFIFDRHEVPTWVHVLAFSLLGIALFTAIMSPITGWVFNVTSQNVYERGPFFLPQVALTYVYLLAATSLVFIFRERVLPQERMLLLLFGVLPILGGMVQVLIYGVLLIWSSVAFTLAIGFIFLQERSMQIDFLSQAITRESFMKYMHRRILRGSEFTQGIVFVDMNGLKNINDQYGHAEGDDAIKTMVRVFKENLHQNEYVVRMGGDEFILVLNTFYQNHLDDRMAAILDAMGEHNSKNQKPYVISFSHGSGVFQSTQDELELFIRRLDRKMYEVKKKFKN